MTFQESDLTFQFSDADWQIEKYDAHRYFKTLSGAGLKGVDFLGIYCGREVVLWEVKNYHTNQAVKNHRYLIVEHIPTFIENIVDKVTDTLMAIRVIQQYLMRQWWYRFYGRYRSFIPTFLVQYKDWFFWHQVQEKINNDAPLIFVLWLEVDDSFDAESWNELSATIQNDLNKQLKEYGIKVVVSSRKQPSFDTSLQVTEANKTA